jgi:hypothetical protein
MSKNMTVVFWNVSAMGSRPKKSPVSIKVLSRFLGVDLGGSLPSSTDNETPESEHMLLLIDKVRLSAASIVALTFVSCIKMARKCFGNKEATSEV